MKNFGITEFGLTDLYIDTILNQSCENFKGCYSCDNIPNSISKMKNASIIINLSPESHSGTHFVTIILKPKSIFYIDSFGRECQNVKINEFMLKCDRPISFNTICIQDLYSNYCGFFCMMFCLYYDKPRSYKLIFSKKLSDNDMISVDYINQLIKKAS